jgi:hypothetical protein
MTQPKTAEASVAALTKESVRSEIEVLIGAIQERKLGYEPWRDPGVELLREKLGELLAGKVTPEQAKSFASNLLQTLMEGPPDGDEAQA